LKSINIKAPAKINIGLNILSKRPDGYHNLSTLFYPLHDLCDELSFYKSEENKFIYDESIIELSGENLVLKAKSIIENYINKELKVEIILEKRIPIGAGLGGGSSDAGATLISLNELFALKLSHSDLMKLALQLGSDVPFFIKSKPAIGKSRGEVLAPLNFHITFPILVVNPLIHVSTKKAFNLLKSFSLEKEIIINSPQSFNDVKEFRHIFSNDFEQPVFELYPEIKEIKEALYSQGAGFASMTGSGSTVFGLFANEEQAEKARNIFPEKYLRFISRPVMELM
jgi:4-diphosphocytidyl-2-C-methyl-D-erythritol kinase